MTSNQNMIIKSTGSTDSYSSSALGFEVQKCLLLQKAQFGLSQIRKNLNYLNDNLKVTIDIGSQFNTISHLWSSFHKAINENDNNDTNNNDNISKFDRPFFECNSSTLKIVPKEEGDTENQRYVNIEHQLDYNATDYNSNCITEIVSFDKD